MRKPAFGFGTPFLCLLFFTLALVVLPSTGRSEERIPIIFPPVASPQVPPVFFPHDRHVEFMEKSNAECTVCHRETDQGMTETFLDVATQPKDKQVSYMHATCTQCHQKANAGPRLVECRSCHDQAVANAMSEKK